MNSVMDSLAFRKCPAEDEVRRLLRLRCRRDDERPVAFELTEPPFKVGGRVVNRLVRDVRKAAEKRAAEFGDQFLFRVGIGAKPVSLDDARALQPLLVAG